jgi:hypothetical protein
MLVNLPSKNQKLLSSYSEQDQIKEHVIRGETLVNDLARTDVKLLNLVPAFADLPASKYYFEHDGHMNRSGHQIIASNIHQEILPDVYQLLRRTTSMASRPGLSASRSTENQLLAR